MGKTVCVTGASGYIASWVVLKLLEKGYTVHGTVRDPADEKKCAHLNKLPGAAERLKLFKADVLDYESLLQAISGCAGVFHTACPVALKFENPQDVLGPAIEGTRNVMTACHHENIKRVVYTSSAAAVAYDQNPPKGTVFDESCWSDPEFCKETEKWYPLAKTLSEKLAWDLSKELSIDLIVILPVLVLGPALQPGINFSLAVITNSIDGSNETFVDMPLPVVDVRDVTEAHIAAFENPAAGGRYICSKETVSFETILESLKKHFPHFSYAKREGEVAKADSDFSNEKVLSLIKGFISFEKTLVDMIISLQERGSLRSS